MTRIITHTDSDRHGALDEEDANSFKAWEESLLLPIPSEEPPLLNKAAAPPPGMSPLRNAIERTVMSESRQLTIELQLHKATIKVPRLEDGAERDDFLHDLMVLRDSYAEHRNWVVDFSQSSKIPLMILGALREYHAALTVEGGGVTIVLGDKHRAEPALEMMIRRMFAAK